MNLNQVQPLDVKVSPSPLSSGAGLSKNKAAPTPKSVVAGSDDRRGAAAMQFSHQASSRERSERVILQDDAGLRMQSELYHT